jgi:hypothetical protein
LSGFSGRHFLLSGCSPQGLRSSPFPGYPSDQGREGQFKVAGSKFKEIPVPAKSCDQIFAPQL